MADPSEKTEVLAGGDPRLQPRIGRYRLERRLGAGGMAEVFLARSESDAGPHGKFEKLVVIKRIRPQLVAQPRFVEMFLREGRLLASLDHPNIVRIIELDEDKGEYFLALEYLEGLSLREVAERHWAAGRELPIEAIITIVAEAALGLEYAHNWKDPAGRAADIVHRDVSPDNLFVTTSGTTKVIDFGIAKRAGMEQLTQQGELKGKVPFMSPEQLHGLPLDPRSDLFSMGVVLYWLFTGRRPFDGANDVHTMKAILEDNPRPPRSWNPKVPSLLEEIVLSLLEKDRDKRFKSAGHLHDALMSLVVGLPRGAPQPADLVSAALGMRGSEHEVVPAGLAASPALPWPEAKESAPPPAVDLARLPTRPHAQTVPIATQRVAFMPVSDTEEGAGPATELLAPISPIDTSTDEHKRATSSVSSAPSPADGLPLSEPVISVERIAAADSLEGTELRPPPQPEPALDELFAPAVDAGPAITTELAPVPPEAPRSRVVPVLAGVASALVIVLAGAWFGGLFRAAPAGTPDAGALVPVLVVPALDAGAIAAASAADTDAGTAPVDVEAAGDAGEAAAVDAGEVVEMPQGSVDAGPAHEVDDGRDDGEKAERGSPHVAMHRVSLLAPSTVQWQSASGDVYGTGNRVVRLPEAPRVVFAVDLRRGGKTRVVVEARQSRVEYTKLPHQQLQVRARPFAEVFLGKERLGITPLEPVDVVAGTYELRFVYKKITRVEHVEVKPNRAASVNVLMTKEH